MQQIALVDATSLNLKKLIQCMYKKLIPLHLLVKTDFLITKITFTCINDYCIIAIATFYVHVNKQRNEKFLHVFFDKW